MSWRRAKPTGWAAFDLKQREKDTSETHASDELYPSLPSTVTLEVLPRNNHLSARPFSSVIQCSYPAHVSNKDSKASKTASSIVPRENKFGKVFRQLKVLYSWADDSLIEDVVAATGNDFDKASSFLKAMVHIEKLDKIEDNKVVKTGCEGVEPMKNDEHERQDVFMEKISGPSNTCSVLDSGVSDNNRNAKDKFDFLADKFLNGIDINGMQDKLSYVPIEPEWEEDDVYLSCRKDAIKMMRAAARHSKAATNSYLRGDHFSAQQFSLKANEKWVAAEKLNAKAAREILSTRNENNGIWRLDLHGLHATEAIEALQERLQMIETHIFFKGSNRVIPNNLRPKAGTPQASSLDGCGNGERSDEVMIFGQKPMLLEAITGIGNHSKGGAALPTAVKTFLSENGYRFDEARQGVIMVRPKVRHT